MSAGSLAFRQLTQIKGEPQITQIDAEEQAGESEWTSFCSCTDVWSEHQGIIRVNLRHLRAQIRAPDSARGTGSIRFRFFRTRRPAASYPVEPPARQAIQGARTLAFFSANGGRDLRQSLLGNVAVARMKNACGLDQIGAGAAPLRNCREITCPFRVPLAHGTKRQLISLQVLRPGR